MFINDYVQLDILCLYMDLCVVSKFISEGCYFVKIDLQFVYRLVFIYFFNYWVIGLKWQFVNVMLLIYLYDIKFFFGVVKSF